MIALRLRFPTGRYHATPWGRHVNEAAIAWPPEPVRILRALIACHHRKADKTQFSDDALADLVDALADELPIYRLPQAVHAHTRHYMPAPVKTTLVFDAFARFDANKPLIVGWPGLSLSPEQRAHLDHLATRLGYLGRAESWVEAEVCEWSGDDANAKPHNHDGEGNERASDSRFRLVPFYAPLTPDAYRERHQQLIHDERERRRAGWTKKSKPTAKALDKDMKDILATLPERLASALAVDTSDLHAAGWSDPPACRRVLYAAPEPASVWCGPRQRTTRARPDPTVARFVLAGRPRPRIEDAVKIGELMRLAAMAQFGWTKDKVTGRRRPNAPSVISGRNADGRPFREPEHRHTFWLAEDADEDGEIDHIVVYAAAGFDREVRGKLDGITKLWIAAAERASSDESGDAASEPRQEWRLALEGFGTPKDFHDASRLLRESQCWESVTPFLAAGHLKSGGYPAEARRLLARRLLFSESNLGAVKVDVLSSRTIHGRERRPIHFHRFRSGGREMQPDPMGTFLRLTFPSPIEGPLALGFGSHFGLGLFAALA
jgi:CRISPR-associated protein Csb2